MKTRIVILIAIIALAASGTRLYAEQLVPQQGGYMGIELDTAALPAILEKHLRLSPGQGLQIVNVQVDTPADTAGLERNDIIIGLEGRDVDDYKDFVKTVRDSGAGTKVSLKIIHLGKRKTVKLKLAGRAELVENPEWKYPREPVRQESWQPGRIFHMRPGEQDWTEIPWNELQQLPETQIDIQKFLGQRYEFHYSENGESYTIVIEGDLRSDATCITVRSGNTEYQVTVKDIDELPKKYRKRVEEALESAKENARKRPQLFQYDLRFPPDGWKKEFFKKFEIPQPKLKPPHNQDGEMFEQMRELKKQLEELQKNQRQMLERLEKEHKEGHAEEGTEEGEKT